MKVGDLVRLANITNGCHGETGLAIEVHANDHRDPPWFRVIILFPSGCIDWEYDVDLEVVSEGR